MTFNCNATSLPAHDWTPEKIMQDFHGELKGVLFVHCMEWYTNDEVECKINLGRNIPINNANMFAEHKRNLTNIALECGSLPTEFKLQFDKRRLINLTARLGEEQRTVVLLGVTIKRRESLQVPMLSATPTLQELEAARPEHRHRASGKARETRDYWNKFLAAAARHSSLEIQRAYTMAKTAAHENVLKARQIVTRMREVEELERRGQSIPQTYTPPGTLRPGQQIYTPPPSILDPVAAANKARSREKIRKRRTSSKPQTPRNRIVTLKLPPQTGQQKQTDTLPSFRGNGTTPLKDSKKRKRATSPNPQIPRSKIVILKLPLQTPKQPQTPGTTTPSTASCPSAQIAFSATSAYSFSSTPAPSHPSPLSRTDYRPMTSHQPAPPTPATKRRSLAAPI